MEESPTAVPVSTVPAATPAPAREGLLPLPYHAEVVRLLRGEESHAWAWAGSAAARSEHADDVRSQLLKNTYRLDADAHPALHASGAAAAARLGVTAPVTLYQGNEDGTNAALFYLPGQAHIVFYGALLERVTGAELEAVIGHELAHFALWERDGGDWLTAHRLLGMAANDPASGPSVRETARLFALYTEVFADRGGAVACGALEPGVAALVKVNAPIASVNATSYLRQADEICATLDGRSDAYSHPETFIRARALRLWCEAHAPGADPQAAAQAEAWLRETIEGRLAIDALDLAGQQRLADLTRRVIGQFLRPRALRSEALLACAREFFPGMLAADSVDAALRAEIEPATGVHDYFAAVLMDFAVADRALDDVPFAQALVLARELGLEGAFENLAMKALRLTKRQFAKARADADPLLARITEAGHE